MFVSCFEIGGIVVSVKNKKVFVTKEGLEKLEKEYEYLVAEKRKDIADRIQKARELGDITENAEYSSALDEQAFIENRISEIAETLKNVAVIDERKQSYNANSLVKVGSTVRVHLEGAEQEFKIVGEVEADPAANRISHESPLGSSLLGRKAGDEVIVDAPIGKLCYTVLLVK